MEIYQSEKLLLAKISNKRENKSRIVRNYKKNDYLIMLKRQGDKSNRKMQYLTEGPYKVLKINKNRTLRIRCENYNETIHVCRLKPFSSCIDKLVKNTNRHIEASKTRSLQTRSGQMHRRPTQFN